MELDLHHTSHIRRRPKDSSKISSRFAISWPSQKSTCSPPLQPRKLGFHSSGLSIFVLPTEPEPEPEPEPTNPLTHSCTSSLHSFHQPQVMPHFNILQYPAVTHSSFILGLHITSITSYISLTVITHSPKHIIMTSTKLTLLKILSNHFPSLPSHVLLFSPTLHSILTIQVTLNHHPSHQQHPLLRAGIFSKSPF